MQPSSLHLAQAINLQLMINNKKELYIGVMSGTSMDAVDATLVSISNSEIQTLAHHSNEIPLDLKQQLAKLCSPGENEIERCGNLDLSLIHI